MAVEIPVIGGDMVELDRHATTIASASVDISDTGEYVHSSWQALGRYYRAPEAEQLLAAMTPVRDVTAAVGEAGTAVSQALSGYAADVASYQRRLDALRIEAADVERVTRTNDPDADPYRIAEEARLRSEVDRIMAEYQAAQEGCAAAIRAVTHNGSVPPLAVSLGVVPPRYAPEVVDDPAYRPWGWREQATPLPTDLPGDSPLPVVPPEVVALGGTLINVPGAVGPTAEVLPPAGPDLPTPGYTPTPFGAGPWIDADGREPTDQGQYTGGLVQVPNPDAHADRLAERLGGLPRAHFANDPDRREFDVITDEYIVQAKPGGLTLGSGFRDQARHTFVAAAATGRTVYYHFDGAPPGPGVAEALDRYSRRFGVPVVIDTDPLAGS